MQGIQTSSNVKFTSKKKNIYIYTYVYIYIQYPAKPCHVANSSQLTIGISPSDKTIASKQNTTIHTHTYRWAHNRSLDKK